MATIPNLAPQPQEQPEQFQPRIEAQVSPDITIIKMQNTPFDIRVQPVPNEIMAQIVPLWLQQHPELAHEIIREVRDTLKRNADILHVVHATKNN